MSLLRHLSPVMRGRHLLVAGAFLFLAYLFANNLSPRPRYVVQTGAKYEQLWGLFGWSSRGESPPRTAIDHVSDDGRQVIVDVYDGKGSRLEKWDPATGANLTPGHWREPDWRQLLGDRQEAGLIKLLDDPAGREYLQDAEAWDQLRWRRPMNDRPADGLAFSSDGRLIAHPPRKWSPFAGLLWALTGGPVVEDARSGRRIATFPVGVAHVLPAPGGCTAISGHHLPRDFGGVFVYMTFDEDASPKRPKDQPYLSLWDLDARRRRAELLLPYPPHHFEYSPDGKYVFATTWSGLVRIWNAETGQPTGDVYCQCRPRFLDGSRMLMGVFDGGRELQFWDPATGRELFSWEPDWPRVGTVGELTIRDGRHIIAAFDPETQPAGGPSVPFVEKVTDWLDDRLPDMQRPHERSQVVVLDAIEQRTVGRVPGLSGTVSPNGRWLATLDADGVVRVWDLPLGRPWLRGFAYAAAVFAGGWVVVGLPRRLRRRPGVPALMLRFASPLNGD